MVIQHVLAPAPFGGAESVVRSLAVSLRRRGHDVSVVAAVEAAEDHPFLAELEVAGIPVFPLVFPGRAYGRERRALAHMLRRFPPDVVHTHGPRSDVLHAPVARLAGIPTVSTVHGFTGGDLKNHLYQWVQRRALPFLDAVVAVSAPLAAELRAHGVGEARLRTIPNGPPAGLSLLARREARRALGVPEEGVRIGWVGRLSHEKGPDLLLEALAAAREGGRLREGTTASVVGDGPLRAELELRSYALGLEGTVRWHGALQGAARLLRAFDVVVLSSRSEGTPLVLLEGIGAGVPVVAAAVGGVADAARGHDVRLVPPGDACALAGAVADALESAAPAAAGGRPRADRAPPAADEWIAAYERVYRDVAMVRAAPEEGSLVT